MRQTVSDSGTRVGTPTMEVNQQRTLLRLYRGEGIRLYRGEGVRVAALEYPHKGGTYHEGKISERLQVVTQQQHNNRIEHGVSREYSG